jgi:hypothetical protein
MGLFGVHMPTIYGEGYAAFRRLQEEILRSSVDHTLFTWPGYPVRVDRPVKSNNLSLRLLTDEVLSMGPKHMPQESDLGPSRIFADSPEEFRGANNMETIPLRDFEKAFGAFADAATIHGGQLIFQVYYFPTQRLIFVLIRILRYSLSRMSFSETSHQSR